VAVDTVVYAPVDGWRYHPKHVEQFPDKINAVMLHLVGYTSILEYRSCNFREKKERKQGIKCLHCCRFVLVMRICVDVTSIQIKMTETIFQLLLDIQVVKKFFVMSTVVRSQ